MGYAMKTNKNQKETLQSGALYLSWSEFRD